MIVYVDVLLVVNIAVNYAVLLTAGQLIKRDTRLFRLLLGALTGALFSLIIFVDIQSEILLFLIKVFSSLLLTLITFGYRSKGEWLRALAAVLTVSLLYSGGIILIYQLLRPPNMLIVNNVPYLALNPVPLVLITAVIYLILLLINRLLRERIKSSVASLRFTVNDKEFSCVAKIDTGCNLTEPFSGAPVIIADDTVLTLAEDQQVRIIPYSTVQGASCLRAVKADQVYINKTEIHKTVYIAVTDRLCDSFHAIINSDIVR